MGEKPEGEGGKNTQKRAGIVGNPSVVRVRKSVKEKKKRVDKQKSLSSCRSHEKLVLQEGKVSSV